MPQGGLRFLAINAESEMFMCKHAFLFVELVIKYFKMDLKLILLKNNSYYKD